MQINNIDRNRVGIYLPSYPQIIRTAQQNHHIQFRCRRSGMFFPVEVAFAVVNDDAVSLLSSMMKATVVVVKFLRV
jgi:hypothetical protein